MVWDFRKLARYLTTTTYIPEMHSLSHINCFQNSATMSFYVGLAVEVEIGNLQIIAFSSYTILGSPGVLGV